MHTVRIEKARYTIRDDRVGFMEHALKYTGKHKPVKAKGGVSRNFPRYGAQSSTADYVREYYIANAGVYTATNNGQIYGHKEYVQSVMDMFQPLSTGITVPEGVDSMEVEI